MSAFLKDTLPLNGSYISATGSHRQAQYKNEKKGIIFWGNSAYSPKILEIKERTIRITMNARNRDSCHQLFKKLKILTLKSQYIFSFLLFVAKNNNLYESNSEIHNISTRFNSDLHSPTANLTFQKGPFYIGIKVFNHLPTSIKNTSHDIKQFR